ncbi:DSD1 family PLP-dependent enzyme [Burkholderia sp. FERM BP-3421]|jgi:D-serine deaminase-like pyridoxal phosphate-dependent protein|uniref:DSD1 family PLP-dependent enzyme n=1 Tax=Burkholderia sp. FERM BP-3421 TaxID=1494466 RepID=UPI00235DC79A|nr:DSD1 family PLP-dependent enzyme [Burkholderia sp. FERM BP-3421]WDD92258.1 DSD1 family PLP-dependent enzyme [Burkholderia sp. FERM BP-3421]
MTTDTLSSLATLDTPAAVLDLARVERNVQRMQARMDALGVAFRPHVKTAKCLEVAQLQRAAGARGITVSTLKEAESFFAAGFDDILYAVGIAPAKLDRALALRRRGCALKLLVDSVDAARAVAAHGRAHGETHEVWIEIDTDGHRAGIAPDDAALPAIGRLFADGGARIGGVLAHAGSSYACDTPAALAALAEQERARCVLAAERLRAQGIPCEAVSVGSTPTALSAASLAGVTEVRAGVYAFFDLVMHNVGVCALDDLALSVVTTVIGHRPDQGWAIVDAGWMALSRDRGTARQRRDYGYGLPCTLDGAPLEGFTISGANQEHGILSRTHGEPCPDIVTRFPLGARLRILPNHACATGAQFPFYHALAADGSAALWSRFHGW